MKHLRALSSLSRQRNNMPYYLANSLAKSAGEINSWILDSETEFVATLESV